MAELSPYRRLSDVLKARYGEKVFKVVLRAGFSCPNRDGRVAVGGCTFCRAEATEPLGLQPGTPIAAQLERGMRHIAARYKARKFIAYFGDHSATDAPLATLRALYQPALATPAVVALAISTRPDALPPPVCALLRELQQEKDLWVEIGLQVADDDVLREMNRQHTVADVVASVEACQRMGLPVCLHLIIGYPGVSRDVERRTAALVGALGVWGVKLHAFHVLEGTVIAERWRRGEVALLSREAHAQRVVDVIERLPPQVVIHRVTAEAPKCFTLAPAWTINKMAAFDAVHAAIVARCTRQGARWSPAGAGASTAVPWDIAHTAGGAKGSPRSVAMR